MQRFETRRVPPLGGFNLTFIALEIRRLLRNRRTVVITIVVPAVLVLIFNNGAVREARGTQLQASLMIGVAVYGAMLGSTAGGAMVSVERALGWSRQLRLTPLRPPAYIAIKLITAMFLGLASVVVVSVVGGLIGASVVTESWFLAALLSWVGGLVYAAFGLFMGYLLPSENVMQLISPRACDFRVGGRAVRTAQPPPVDRARHRSLHANVWRRGHCPRAPAGHSVRLDLGPQRRGVDRDFRPRGGRHVSSRHAANVRAVVCVDSKLELDNHA